MASSSTFSRLQFFFSRRLFSTRGAVVLSPVADQQIRNRILDLMELPTLSQQQRRALTEALVATKTDSKRAASILLLQSKALVPARLLH